VNVLAIVVAPGLATIQDGGRPGYSDVGVPVAGAWHRGRYQLAARLLADRADDSVPVIELLAGELWLDLRSPVDVVVVGRSVATADGRPLPIGTVAHLSAGNRLRVHWAGPGPTYVGIAGWRPPRVLGSCSTDTFSRLGGAVLAVGDLLEGVAQAGETSRVGRFHREEPAVTGRIRVIRADHPLATAVVDRKWTVIAQSRSGTRLRSAGWLARADTIASIPVVAGAIQLTPDGEAIVLGPDGGLTGGYPVVGVVASIDRDRLSLLSVTDEVGFAFCDVRAAAVAFEAAGQSLARAVIDPSTLE
jgi:allophanate hydrolase subunit 2